MPLPAIAAAVVAVLYLLLLGWGMLMRIQRVSDWTRQLTKRGNPYLRAVAGTRLGMFYFNLSALRHVGRRSGRTYVTPLSAYPLGDGFVLAAAYPHVDWLENVLDAGKCSLTWNGSEYALERPELIPRAEAMRAYPRLVRPFLAGAAGQNKFVFLHRAEGPDALRSQSDSVHPGTTTPNSPAGKEIQGMDNTTSGIGVMAIEALDLLIDAVDHISPDSWDQPSNLEGWSLRELVGHVTGSAAKVVTLVEDGEIWGGPSQPSDWICENPAARLRELATRLRDALPGAEFDGMRTSPEGEVPLHRALTYPVSDLAMHAWDIHRSQGRLIELPEDLLALGRGLVESAPEQMLRRPGGFGPAQAAPADATPTARLMAFLGRSVDVGA
ncbi:TIGR03086 family metal-binding protein [Mycobacterium sp. 852014-50255_SCH5639931]|uniref:TIGR03086 family metal-binding protein n=1 Tax=Mycobacterium sp. 852014-50255_SCH5639931 TaxID=1834112 RepID=UPI001E3DB5E6|nr:TIGR03086 family metal-binding protein [Mycobacterium sp. 852014-50255_SCH5639931]